MKYGLFKKEAFGYITQPESKFLDRLLLAFVQNVGMPSLFFCNQEELELVCYSLELIRPLNWFFRLWNNIWMNFFFSSDQVQA